MESGSFACQAHLAGGRKGGREAGFGDAEGGRPHGQDSPTASDGQGYEAMRFGVGFRILAGESAHSGRSDRGVFCSNFAPLGMKNRDFS